MQDEYNVAGEKKAADSIRRKGRKEIIAKNKKANGEKKRYYWDICCKIVSQIWGVRRR